MPLRPLTAEICSFAASFLRQQSGTFGADGSRFCFCNGSSVCCVCDGIAFDKLFIGEFVDSPLNQRLLSLAMQAVALLINPRGLSRCSLCEEDCFGGICMNCWPLFPLMAEVSNWVLAERRGFCLVLLEDIASVFDNPNHHDWLRVGGSDWFYTPCFPALSSFCGPVQLLTTVDSRAQDSVIDIADPSLLCDHCGAHHFHRGRCALEAEGVCFAVRVEAMPEFLAGPPELVEDKLLFWRVWEAVHGRGPIRQCFICGRETDLMIGACYACASIPPALVEVIAHCPVTYVVRRQSPVQFPMYWMLTRIYHGLLMNDLNRVGWSTHLAEFDSVYATGMFRQMGSGEFEVSPPSPDSPEVLQGFFGLSSAEPVFTLPRVDERVRLWATHFLVGNVDGCLCFRSAGGRANPCSSFHCRLHNGAIDEQLFPGGVVLGPLAEMARRAVALVMFHTTSPGLKRCHNCDLPASFELCFSCSGANFVAMRVASLESLDDKLTLATHFINGICQVAYDVALHPERGVKVHELFTRLGLYVGCGEGALMSGPPHLLALHRAGTSKLRRCDECNDVPVWSDLTCDHEGLDIDNALADEVVDVDTLVQEFGCSEPQAQAIHASTLRAAGLVDFAMFRCQFTHACRVCGNQTECILPICFGCLGLPMMWLDVMITSYSVDGVHFPHNPAFDRLVSIVSRLHCNVASVALRAANDLDEAGGVALEVSPFDASMSALEELAEGPDGE